MANITIKLLRQMVSIMWVGISPRYVASENHAVPISYQVVLSVRRCFQLFLKDYSLCQTKGGPQHTVQA